MAITVYKKTALIGGGANALDGIDGNILNDGDFAFCFISGAAYIYQLDADSGLAESSPDVIAPDVNAGDKRWILQSIVGQEYDTIFIPAGAFAPSATNGAEPGTDETATNKLTRDYFDFDPVTEESIECEFPMPEDWDRGTIKAKVVWKPATDTGVNAGDKVEWEIGAVAIGDGDSEDAALGTTQVVYDEVLTGLSAMRHITDETPAITVGGSPALGDLVHWKVSRNVDSANDDMNADARFRGLWIQYKRNQAVTAW